MAYSEEVAQRVRTTMTGRDGVVEKKMFGGIAFMVDGNMSVGVQDECLMVRVGKEGHNDAVTQPHARPMDFTGRPMKGFVYVDPPGFASDSDLAEWVQRSLDFVLTLPPK